MFAPEDRSSTGTHSPAALTPNSELSQWLASPLLGDTPAHTEMAPRRPASAAQHPAIRNIRRRLERWELPHLRQHAADQEALIEQLRTELEETKRQLAYAEDCAEMWRNDALDALNEQVDADPEHRCIGLTKSGAVMVVASPWTQAVVDDFGNLVRVAA